MSVIHPGLFLIMHRFPSEKNNLRRLYLDSQSFQTLCDDYQKCTEAIEHWTHSRHDQALARSREYRELRQGLEWEIKERIDAVR
jgi:hypothetical protein